MRTQTLEALEIALDAIWKEVGNGYGTEYERLVHELQRTIDDEKEFIKNASN